MAYLTTQRIQLTEGWLRDGERSVSQAAEYFGYNSEPAFRRDLKRHLEGTPPVGRKSEPRLKRLMNDFAV